MHLRVYSRETYVNANNITESLGANARHGWSGVRPMKRPAILAGIEHSAVHLVYSVMDVQLCSPPAKLIYAHVVMR